jgi:hypothetical protein
MYINWGWGKRTAGDIEVQANTGNDLLFVVLSQ